MGNYVSSQRAAPPHPPPPPPQHQQREAAEDRRSSQVGSQRVTHTHTNSRSHPPPSHQPSYIRTEQPFITTSEASAHGSALHRTPTPIPQDLYTPADYLTSSPSFTSSVVAHDSSTEQSSVAGATARSHEREDMTNAHRRHRHHQHSHSHRHGQQTQPYPQPPRYHHSQRHGQSPSPTSPMPNGNEHQRPIPPSSTSRVGSRFLPSNVARGLLGSGEETAAEGRAHRMGVMARNLQQRFQHSQDADSQRLVPEGGRSSRPSQLTPESVSSGRRFANPLMVRYREQDGVSSRNAHAARRRRTRFSQLRHSIAAPISNLFGHQSQSSAPSNDNSSLSSPYSARRRHSDNVDPIQSLLAVSNRSNIAGLNRPSSSEDEDMENTPRLTPHNPNPFATSRRGSQGQNHNQESQPESQDGRSGEGDTLTRVLQMAASAIASQLGSQPSPSTPDPRSEGEVNMNNSLRSLVQSLQQAAAQQTEAQDNNDESEGGSGLERRRSINFLRAFLFDGQNAIDPAEHFRNVASSMRFDASAAEDSNPDPMDLDEPHERESQGVGSDPGAYSTAATHGSAPEHTRPPRTVTLVVVGVRSVPNSRQSQQANDVSTSTPIVGGLRENGGQSVSRFRNMNFLRSTASGGSRGRASRIRRTLYFGRRRSTPDAWPLSRSPTTEREPLRYPRTQRGILRRRASDPTNHHFEPDASASPSSSLPRGRRVSIASSVQSRAMEPMRVASPTSPAAPPNDRRRASDTRADHPREESPNRSRSPSRRGDTTDHEEGQPSAGRSWLIYVIGTHLTEGHPALLMPSLLTGNPTYEDMVQLANFLGPAKPPVANEDDVARAGGLYKLVETGDGVLVAELLEDRDGTIDEQEHEQSQDQQHAQVQKQPESDGDGAVPGHLTLVNGERCLVCLSDYEAGEEVRRLTKCKHMFHRTCIDQWLTTGRNTCPMCRSPGVAETSNNSEPTSSAQAAQPEHA